VAGIGLGLEALKEFVTESLSLASAEQRAAISLTALTGSAKGAQETIEKLKELAMSDALSFPELLAADQRMTAFGLTLRLYQACCRLRLMQPGPLTTSIEAATNAMVRISSSGQVAARSLMQLGLTTTDLAKTMQISTDDIKGSFKALDQSERLEVLSVALQKFGGIAQQQAATIGGSWQQVRINSSFCLPIWQFTFAANARDHRLCA